MDQTGFGEWLDNIAVLDQLRFDVKLPNPDSAEAFDELVEHMNTHDAGEMTHVLRPKDHRQGLSRDIESDKLGAGLMEMARRSLPSCVRRDARKPEGGPSTTRRRRDGESASACRTLTIKPSSGLPSWRGERL